MPVTLEEMGLIDADGRSAIHVPSDNVARDVAKLEYLLRDWASINRLTKEYEIVPEGHSVWLLEKLPRI